MGVAKPTGRYAEQMLDLGGWPDVDEHVFYDRAEAYTQVFQQVTEVLETCRQQRGKIFNSDTWSGSAAGAASGQLGTDIDELVKLQSDLATAITWQRYVAGSIEQAKSDIDDNVAAARERINLIERDTRMKPEKRTATITSVINATRAANAGLVEGTAEQILANKDWKLPDGALKNLLDQRTPPPSDERDSGRADFDRPKLLNAMPDSTATATQPSATGPSPSAMAPPVPTTIPAASVTPAATVGSAPTAPAAPRAPLSPAVSAAPLGAGGGGKSITSAPASSWAPPRPGDSSPGVAPASAHGMPAAAGPRGAAAGPSSGAAAGSGAGAAAGASPSTRPAAVVGRSATRGEQAAHPTSANRAVSSDGAAPGVPVSPARAERDAAMAAADASRRGETDPLTVARRIAAALNAPDKAGAGDLKFFWVTAVTTEGAIVVANTYGLAYIPDGMQLLEHVHMASADESIPATERARWATYPLIAVQGWAEHRNTKLRAVIATEEQFANSDPGVAKVVLKPDDIPEIGATTGRSRLEVVNPKAAARLAATPDPRLVALLPPQDPSPPADKRSRLWLEVMRPLASNATGREVAHLRAFQTYAAHTQEMVLSEAHVSADPVAQRCAVADWLYWKHVTQLLDSAELPARKPKLVAT
jgi:hypothetical protein